MPKSVLIIGAGVIGIHLSTIFNKTDEITFVDKNPAKAHDATKYTGRYAVQGDGSSLGLLNDIHFEKFDVLIAATEDDKVNLHITKLAKEVGIPTIIARANLPESKEIFQKEEVSIVFCPAELSAKAIEMGLKNRIGQPNEKVLSVKNKIKVRTI